MHLYSFTNDVSFKKKEKERDRIKKKKFLKIANSFQEEIFVSPTVI